jgi:hypothetical protein
MHLKFLAHGTGDPKKAVRYLLGTHDHNGRERAGVCVLRGNPQIVGLVAASLNTVHRYTSGVISWALEDAPTAVEIDQVLADFERAAFPGLEPDQYSWSAIQHVDDDGSTHVHVFASRVELRSGKALNAAPPGWERTFGPLRDYWNYRAGWARPDDPARARPLQPGRLALASKSAYQLNVELETDAHERELSIEDFQAALSIEPDPKVEITTWLMRRVHSGQISTRADLLTALREIGTVNRSKAGYISILVDGHARPLRLKGALFSEAADFASLRAGIGTPAPVRGRDEPNPAAAEAAKRKLEAAIEKRAAYNLTRYSQGPRPAPPLPTDPAPADQVFA